ncbi:MAG: IS200/IS605 family transposase [Janthinobacterium lividum]
MLKNKLSVAVHFVWATWDRQPLITEEVKRELYKYMEAVCGDDRCEVLAIGGMPDHVHLLVLLSNTVTLGNLMRHVKGGSSRLVTETLTPNQWFAWQGSYGAFSVSQGNISKVIDYIKDQKQHHALGTLWPNAEETNELILSVPAKAATWRPRPTA